MYIFLGGKKIKLLAATLSIFVSFTFIDTVNVKAADIQTEQRGIKTITSKSNDKLSSMVDFEYFNDFEYYYIWT